MTPEVSPTLACSVQTAALGERPAGTAGSEPGYLLVELGTPWPRAVNGHPDLGRAPGTPFRVLGIRSPDGDPEPGALRQVVLYRRPEGAFASMERWAGEFPVDELPAVVTAIQSGDLSLLGLEPGRDVLVCGHVERDQCCGTKGPALVAELPPIDGRLWLGSHLGGHRFAPTLVDFPSGLTWAHLDPATATAALRRTLDGPGIERHLRGCVAFTPRAAQAADGAALARHGWDWAEAVRTARAGEPDADGTVVVEVTSGARSDRFTVRPGRTLPVPECLAPLDEAVKAATELLVD